MQQIILRCKASSDWSGHLLVLAVSIGLGALIVAHRDVHGAAVMAAIFIASLVSSIAGFAFSAICGAMLFRIPDDPIHIVQLMITCSIANQARMTWDVRRSIDWRGLSVYLVGGGIGLILGIWVLLHVERALYVHALGGFLLVYGGYMLLRKPMILRRQHAALDFGSGLLSGITGGAAGFPSAFVSVWCSLKGWDKTRQRGILQPYVLIMQILALLALDLTRGAGAGFAVRDLIFIPASLLGTSLGLAVFRRLSDRQFGRVGNVLLIFSGVSFVV